MKISEVPVKAFNAKPTSIPTKVVAVPDWAEFYAVVAEKGFVIVECDEDEIRTTNAGAEESVPVKAFNSWVRANLKRHIRTKRISKTRWFVTL